MMRDYLERELAAEPDADDADDVDDAPRRERSKIDYSARAAAWQARLRRIVEEMRDFGRMGTEPLGRTARRIREKERKAREEVPMA